MNLIKGDCLIELKKLKDKSVDFVYLDLPFGQTSCHWDKKINLKELWIELKRIARNDRTPFFFSCTTKFGFDLIEANKAWFRWDLVWKKNRAAGFLNAYKLPMRKHEMVYCFAKKSPAYDVSSHLTGEEKIGDSKNNVYLKEFQSRGQDPEYYNKEHIKKVVKDPLPTSIIPPTDEHELVYCFAKKSPAYDVSSHKEFVEESKRKNGGKNEYEVYGKEDVHKNRKYPSRTHKELLPTSIIPPTDEHELVYCFAKKSPAYDVSSHSEFIEDNRGDNNNVVGDNIDTYGTQGKKRVNTKTHKIPLPTSIIPPTDEHELVYCFAKKCPEYDVSSHLTGEEKIGDSKNDVYLKEFQSRGQDPEYYNKEHIKKVVKEPLPTSEILLEDEQPSSWCEFDLDTKTGHRTAKPIKLMEFLLKYWTKEGQTILDPTMGSGSMGIACKKMNRDFIGIEMDDDIYELAKKRIGV